MMFMFVSFQLFRLTSGVLTKEVEKLVENGRMVTLVEKVETHGVLRRKGASWGMIATPPLEFVFSMISCY